MIFNATFGMAFIRRYKISQHLLTIKLIVIFLFMSLSQVSANVNNQSFTLNEKNVSIETIFKSIEKQSEYSFLYDKLELSKARKVSINVKDAPIENVLDICFKDQPLSYKIFEKTIVLKMKSIIQEKLMPEPIKGKVVDEKGIPIPGVTVKVNGTKKITITDQNGLFTLDASAGEVLTISNIGFVAKEVVVGNDKDYNIVLKTQSSDLNEVVVTALGITKEKR